MVSIVSLAVLVVWIVNNSGGSVIIAILAHWSANRFEALDGATAPQYGWLFCGGGAGRAGLGRTGARLETHARTPMVKLK
jgi:hypothetical protein